MNDDQNPRSGSRWEPEPDTTPDQPTTEDEVTDVEATAGQPAATDRWTSRLRGRGALAASGVGLVAISGLGGFALGHATAGEGDSRFVRTDMEDGGGPRPDTDGEFRGRGDGDGRITPPDGGRPPNGPDQSDDERQDDDAQSS